MNEQEVTYRGQVLPEWTDYNGHLRDAFYMLIFSYATDGFMERVGLGERDREISGNSLFTLESHINYLVEVKADAWVEVRTRVLAYDKKRVHLYFQLYREGLEAPLAASEQMFLHVELKDPKSAPFSEAVAQKISDFVRLQGEQPKPEWCGRVMQIPVRS